MIRKFRVQIAIILLIAITGVVYLLVHRRNPKPSSAPAPSQKNEYTILDDRANVKAIIENVFVDTEVVYPAIDITISISREKENYEYESEYTDCRDIDDLITRLKESVVWRGKYLLVPVSCGGGNAWRCDVEEVFMLSGGRLVHVGEAGTESEGDEYEKGRFHDIYDNLEENNLTSHSAAPLFEIIIYEKNGAMIVNLSETWNENQKTYSKYKLYLDGLAAHDNSAGVDEILPPLLYNSALSKYCQRQEDMEHWRSVAKLILAPDLAAELDSTLSTVIPGELPEQR